MKILLLLVPQAPMHVLGFTVFIERAILGRLYGQQTMQQHAANGYLSLQEAVHSLGEDHPFTCLVPDLSSGVDPDDAFSKIRELPHPRSLLQWQQSACMWLTACSALTSLLDALAMLGLSHAMLLSQATPIASVCSS